MTEMTRRAEGGGRWGGGMQAAIYIGPLLALPLSTAACLSRSCGSDWQGFGSCGHAQQRSFLPHQAIWPTVGIVIGSTESWRNTCWGAIEPIGLTVDSLIGWKSYAHYRPDSIIFKLWAWASTRYPDAGCLPLLTLFNKPRTFLACHLWSSPFFTGSLMMNGVVRPPMGGFKITNIILQKVQDTQDTRSRVSCTFWRIMLVILKTNYLSRLSSGYTKNVIQKKQHFSKVDSLVQKIKHFLHSPVQCCERCPGKPPKHM